MNEDMDMFDVDPNEYLYKTVTATEELKKDSDANLNAHCDEDFIRWQQISDAIAASYAAAISKAQEIYAGTPDLNYDFTQGTVVIGNNGLLSVGDSGSWAATSNGCIVCTYSAIVGAVKTVSIDDTVVWTTPVSLLGIGATPSDPIRINSGQVVSSTGLLGLGESLNVSFYPNLNS